MPFQLRNRQFGLRTVSLSMGFVGFTALSKFTYINAYEMIFSLTMKDPVVSCANQRTTVYLLP